MKRSSSFIASIATPAACSLPRASPLHLRTLHALMRDGEVEKRYLALVKGKWELGKKRIDVPLRTDIRVGGERTVKAHADWKRGGERLQAGSVFRQEGLTRGGIARDRPYAPNPRARRACRLSAGGR